MLQALVEELYINVTTIAVNVQQSLVIAIASLSLASIVENLSKLLESEAIVSLTSCRAYEEGKVLLSVEVLDLTRLNVTSYCLIDQRWCESYTISADGRNSRNLLSIAVLLIAKHPLALVGSLSKDSLAFAKESD